MSAPPRAELMPAEVTMPDPDPSPTLPASDDPIVAEDAGHDGPGPLAAVGAAAALVALAVWGLTRKPFWIDEGISAGATNELVATWKGTGGTMALYYALLTPWSWVSMHRGWLRLPSVAFAAVAVILLWQVGRRAFDRRVATVASVACAFSWLMVRYAQEARSYALVAALTTLSWLALVSAIRAEDEASRRRWWRAFAIATVLAPLAHGLAVLQFGAQVAWMASGPDRGTWLRRTRPVFIGVAAILSILVVGGANDVASWIPPLDVHQVVALLAAFTAPSPAAGLVVGLAVLLGVATCVQRRQALADPVERWMALIPLAWGLLPVLVLLVVSVLRPYLLARYVMASAPGIALLVAFAILGPDVRTHRVRAAAVGVPVALALLFGQLSLHAERGDDWSGAAREVATGARSGDEVIFASPAVRSSFDFAWNELPDADRATVPGAFSPIEPIGQLRRFYLIHAPELLARDAADHHAERYWVIDEDGESIEPDAELFLRDRQIASRYRVVSDRVLDGGVRVVLVERR